jgi:hypothetical protein
MTTWVRTHPWLTGAIVVGLFVAITVLQYVLGELGGPGVPGGGTGDIVESP